MNPLLIQRGWHFDHQQVVDLGVQHLVPAATARIDCVGSPSTLTRQPQKRYLSRKEAAAWLGISDSTLDRWINRKARPLPCYKPGGCGGAKFLLEDLENFMERYARPTGPEPKHPVVDARPAMVADINPGVPAIREFEAMLRKPRVRPRQR